MSSPEHYKNVMNEIIQRQSAVLGPDIAIAKAQAVAGLKIDNDGKVSAISGSEQEVLQRLVDTYFELSGQIVRNILNPVFQKYPDVKVNIGKNET